MHIYRGLKYKFKSNTPSVNVNVAPLNLTAIDEALKIARSMNKKLVGTEHLLLAAIREEGSKTYHYIKNNNLSIEDVRAAIVDVQVRKNSSAFETKKELIFDSDICDWDVETSTFENHISNKEKLIFLIENKENERFGYYLHTKIEEKYREWISTDNQSFLFTIESHNQLIQPMKYDIIPTIRGMNLSDLFEMSLSVPIFLAQPSIITRGNIWHLQQCVRIILLQ